MEQIAEALLIHGDDEGVKLLTKNEGDEWEFVLASMLIEKVALKQGWTVEEACKNFSECYEESGPAHFHITREEIDSEE